MIVRRQATRRPRARECRVRYQKDVRRLRAWAQGWKELLKPPSHEKALDSKQLPNFTRWHT